MVMNPRELANEQAMMDFANQLIQNNVPIENIIQQTGLSRNLVQNLVNSQLSIDRNLMQPTPAPAGIGSLDPDIGSFSDIVKNLEPTLNENQKQSIEFGVDLGEFLSSELGLDKESTDGPQTLKNAGLYGDIVDQNISGVQKQLEGLSILDSINATDEETFEVYKKAAEKLYGDSLDLTQYVDPEDRGLPFMALGNFLFNAGTKGEEWGTALFGAINAFATTKKAEQKRVAGEMTKAELGNAKAINELSTSLFLADIKNKQAIEQARLKQSFEAPKFYQIANEQGSFVASPVLALDDATANYYSKKFQGRFREKPTNVKLQDVTLYGKNGEIFTSVLSEDALRDFLPIQAGGTGIYSDSILKAETGKPSSTNMKYYRLEGQDGTVTKRWLNPDQYNSLQESNLYKNVIALPTTTTLTPAITNDENATLRFITAEEFLNNPTGYSPITNSGYFNAETGEFKFGAGGMNSLEKGGMAKAGEIKNLITDAETAYTNFFISADEQDKLFDDLIEAGIDPDLAFTDVGAATQFADRIRLNLKSFGDLFRDVDKGKYSFYIGENKVDYETYKSSVLGSADFDKFKTSNVAQFLEQLGITGEALEASLFDLAMLGAASYSPNKGGLDLRAISDFETKQFMKIQGSAAGSFKSFENINNLFRRKLIDRNIAQLKQFKDPLTLSEIVDKSGQPLKTQVDLIISGVDQRITDLEERRKKYQTKFEDIDLTGTPKRFSMTGNNGDPGNESLVAFNIVIEPNSKVAQNLGITQRYAPNTQTDEGTFIDIMNKIQLATTLEERDALFENLSKNLSEEEYKVLQVFLTAAGKVGEISGTK